MTTLSIKVIGKVQGVWFRASAQQKAQALGLEGWVKNEPDGSVLVLVQGSEDKLGSFSEWCHEGPEHARVDKVVSIEVKEELDSNGFEIKRS